MKLHQKMTMTIITLIAVLVLGLSLLFFQNWYASMQRQVALDAMDQALILAENEVIKDNILIDNGYIVVNKQVEAMTLKTRIQYLYIVNREAIYFAHPIPSKLNTPVAEGDIEIDLTDIDPHYYYDLSQNAVVEGYAPIYSDGEWSGYIIVGIYNGQILQSLKASAVYPLIFAVLFLGIGSLAALKLSQSIKSDIFGLEPAEIAVLHQQRELILENIGEGIIAIDRHDRIALINASAKVLIDDQLTEGMSINESSLKSHVQVFKRQDRCQTEGEMRMAGGKIVSLQMVKLSDMSDKIAMLIKVQDMSQVRKKAEALTNMEQLTQALRAQNHEFMNKLHTISGLIQLDEIEEALRFINTVSQSQQNFIKRLNQTIKVPTVSGLLLSKYSKAVEHKIKLELDEESWLEKLPRHAHGEDITSLIGNLIDNAIDALSEVESPVIQLGLYEELGQLIIEVKDNGHGFVGPIEAYLIEGVSSKGENRGYGLSIVTHTVEALSGKYSVKDDEGVTWQISLPMEVK